MFGNREVGGGGAEDVVSSSYWKKVNDDVNKRVKAADKVVDFYKDVVHSNHNLLRKQDLEIGRLKKLLEGRVALQEQGSISGVIAPPPVQSPGDQEGKDALAVFPEELWGLVLDKVDNADDLHSCYLTCKLFSQILEPTKVQWLFPKIFPLIYHQLGKRETLNSRATCKRWMHSVDHRIDNNIESSCAGPYNCIQDFFKNYNDGYPPPFSLFNFPSPVRVHSLFRQENFPILKLDPAMRLHPRNPFLGRTVSILDFFTMPTFINEVLAFLDKCGQHIYYLIIRAPQTRVANARQFLHVLNQTIQKTPNLKTLRLSLRSLHPPSEVVLPTLCYSSSLETLIIQRLPSYCLLDEQRDMFADVLIAPFSEQLVRLEIIFWSKRFLTFHWPALKELKLNCVTSEQTLLELLQIHLPALQSLHIVFSPNMRERIGLVYHHLLKITNHFPELSSLELGNLRDVLCDSKGIIPLPPDLYSSSKLTTLKVFQHVNQGQHWNRFLLRFPFLKYLYIRNDQSRSPDMYWTWYPTGVPSICTHHRQYHYGKEIFTATIWKMLPSLQVITYRYGPNYENNNCAYTREGYMMHSVSISLSNVRPEESDDDDSEYNVELEELELLPMFMPGRLFI